MRSQMLRAVSASVAGSTTTNGAAPNVRLNSGAPSLKTAVLGTMVIPLPSDQTVPWPRVLRENTTASSRRDSRESPETATRSTFMGRI